MLFPRISDFVRHPLTAVKVVCARLNVSGSCGDADRGAEQRRLMGFAIWILYRKLATILAVGLHQRVMNRCDKVDQSISISFDQLLGTCEGIKSGKRPALFIAATATHSNRFFPHSPASDYLCTFASAEDSIKTLKMKTSAILATVATLVVASAANKVYVKGRGKAYAPNRRTSSVLAEVISATDALD
jgi:hypothetical protein